jgi:hypothetical protein
VLARIREPERSNRSGPRAPLQVEQGDMKRIFLVPIALAALAGAASMAQATPASPALDAVKSAASEQSGKATPVHYRYGYRYYYYRHHHHHHHHRWW